MCRQLGSGGGRERDWLLPGSAGGRLCLGYALHGRSLRAGIVPPLL